MNYLLSRLFIVFIAYLAMSSAHGQGNVGRWYEVEIILFEHLNPVAHNSEQWPTQANQIDIDNSITLEQDFAFNKPWLNSLPDETLSGEILDEDAQKSIEMPTAYLILPKEQYQLNDSYQRLEDSANYQPLLHIAWQQSMPARATPDRIFIDDQIDETKTDDYFPLLMQVDDRFNLNPYNNVDDEKPVAKDLRGILSLSIARYLHIETDFLFYNPIATNDSLIPHWGLPKKAQTKEENYKLSPLLSIEEAEPEFFRIKGKLRMRSREVHYLDHPLVGMLILFTPLELPKETSEEEKHPELNIENNPDFQVIQDDSF